MVLFLILLLIAVILYIFTLFLNYFAFFDINLKYDLSLFFNRKTKFDYKQIKPTKINSLFKYCFSNQNSLYSNKHINLNKEFILKLSSFVDNQTKENKQKFRAIKNNILIDAVARHIISTLIILQKPILFSELKKQIVNFKLNKKEIGVIKILLTKYLLFSLAKNYIFSIRVDTKIKRFIGSKKYSLNNHSIAGSYAIQKFNPNTEMFKQNFPSPMPLIGRICRVYDLNKLMVLYLKVLYK